MKLDGSRLPALLDDLEAAVGEFPSALGGDAASWARSPQGKWSAGQHTEHVAFSLEVMCDRFEASLLELRAGRLAPRPRRGPLEALVVLVFMREPFPKGGKAPRVATPGPAPSREAVFERLDRIMPRLRALCAQLTPEERDRVWIQNPFIETRRWHYRLFELVRVETTHARHHRRQAVAAAGR